MRILFFLALVITPTISSAADDYSSEGHPAWEIGRFAGWADGCSMKYGRPNNVSYNAGMYINQKVKPIIASAKKFDNDIFMQGYRVGKQLSKYCVRNRSDFLWSEGLNDNKAIVLAFRGISPALQSKASY